MPGAVDTTYTFTATDTITSTKMNNIIDQTVMTSESCLSGGGLEVASGKLTISANAINSSRLAANSVSSSNIVDGTIVNADISPTAAIAGTKISPDFGTQVVTAGALNANGSASSYTVAQLTNTSGVQVQLNANGNTEGNVRTTTNHPFTLSTNNTERMRISAAGNVGVGTSSPSEKLTVIGPSGGTSALFSDNVNSTLSIKHESPGNLLTYNTGGTASQRWVLNGTERVRILSNGNVGIGQTNPQHKLDILDSAGTNNWALRVKTDGVANDSGIWSDSNNDISFDARNRFADLTVSIRSFGNSFLTGGGFGLGTATPNSILHTYGTSDVGNFESSTTEAYVKLLTSEGAGNRVEIANRSGGRMALYNPTSGDVVNVLQNGNVGIGKNNPSTRLDVNGTVTATAFSGPLTGNVTGNVTGSSGSCTGNSATATTASTVSNGAITAAKLNGGQSGDAPIYGVRAWVTFDMTRNASGGSDTANTNRYIYPGGSGNVSSVLKTDTGRFQVNFTTAMQDDAYAYYGSGRAATGDTSGDVIIGRPNLGSKTNSGIVLDVTNSGASKFNSPEVCVSIIR